MFHSNSTPPADMISQSESTSLSEKTLDPMTASTENRNGPATERDLEAAIPPADSTESDNAPPKDPNLVTWDGPNDPTNPRNWPAKTKWSYTIAVSVFTFISPVSSSMVAPALSKVAADLHLTSGFEIDLVLSIFILAYAIGPLFFGPASELYGRVRVLQLSNMWYLGWNLGCGFAQTPAQMFAFRFLAGIGGSAPLVVGGGALSDIWIPEQRGTAVGIYSLAPILGPVVGPIAGGWIAQRTTWRWVFWSSSVAAALIQVVGVIWLKESYAPTILERKRDRLVKKTGNEQLHLGPGSDKTLLSSIGDALVRPVRLFATQPIVQLIALYMAYLFGTNYLLLATFPEVWSGRYGESLGVGGLNYISISLGAFIGVAANICFIDRMYKQLKERNSGVGRPEFRTPSMFAGSIFITAGLFWYGWSAQGRVHWIVPNLGIVVFSAGTIICVQSMVSYTIDSYTRFAASAMAAVAILRSLAGFVFPLFAPYLYSDLGYGWGTSVLAFISIAIGIPAPLIFWRYGPKLRAMSKFAAG